MIENSPAGLVMMMGEVTVTVTGEDRHQAALDPYRIGAGGQRHVAVELAWCTILAGKHRGERAIEVRLDGRRVGELTHLMSERYGPLVRQVAAGGGRPGCEAIVQRTAKGLEITLRLPRLADTAVPTFVVAPVASMPPKRTGRRAGWIAAGVVGAIAFFGIIGSNMDDSPTTSSPSGFVAGETTTDAPTTDTTTTSTVTTTPKPAAPKPKPKPKPKPPAPRTTTPKPAPAPPVQPKPASTCDPNYTGCVPVASDVDCAGGSGNGPEYAVGPVDVIGSDVYDLDRDGDGVACE